MEDRSRFRISTENGIDSLIVLDHTLDLSPKSRPAFSLSSSCVKTDFSITSFCR
jgi:hypothetical protein